MPRVSVLFLTGLLAALPLAGCGNKGQLVLPDQQPKKHKPAQVPAPAQKPAQPPPADPGQPAGGPDAGH